MNQEYELIIPVAAKDFNILINNISSIREMLSPKKISIISSKTILDEYNEKYMGQEDVHFIDEDQLYEGMSFRVLYEYLKNRGAENTTGWYFQQFLKYAYARKCETEYYISWDADTVPLKTIEFFKNDKPTFFTKEENHIQYFRTMKKILNLEKIRKKSFISEGMVFNKIIVNDLINEISEIGSEEWFYNILNSINDKDLSNAGFSEFETYGTYVVTHYPSMYNEEEIKAIRCAKRIFNEIPKREVRKWLGKVYTSMSFEKWDTNIINARMCNNFMFRMVVNPYIYIKSCFLITKIRKK